MVSSGVNFAPSRSGIFDLVEEIAELKRARNAIILAHNYQVKELQEIADYVGDSLGLSYQAAETDADVILFCGVHFMAETAKIVNPTKRVLLPDLDAGCSLSDSCPPDKLEAFLKQHAEKGLANGQRARCQSVRQAGKFLKTWGKKGMGQGEFDVPHTIAIDSRGRVFVGDRQNNRVQVSQPDGTFVAVWYPVRPAKRNVHQQEDRHPLRSGLGIA